MKYFYKTEKAFFIKESNITPSSKKVELEFLQRTEDIKAVMELAGGRRYLYKILQTANLYGKNFTGNSRGLIKKLATKMTDFKLGGLRIAIS